ncbi:hypothetical protein ACFV23_23395 [Streptomyces sp. NPDC059627]
MTATRAAEPTGEGQGREKSWRAPTAFTSWPGYAEDPEVQDNEPADWQEAAPLGDATIFVTAAELKELDEKARELLRPYVSRADHPQQRPATARRVSYVHFGHPTREFETQTPGETEEPHLADQIPQIALPLLAVLALRRQAR